MVLPITALATIVLASWYVILTMRVIGARRTAGVSIGDGDNETLSRRMRGQANFVENVPISLLVMAVAESQTVTVLPAIFSGALVLAAGGLVVGRILHGYAFCFTDHWGFGRMWGMVLTFLSMIALIALALFAVVA